MTVVLTCIHVNCFFVLIRAMTCNEFQDNFRLPDKN